jgi:hypothetical protein
MATEDDGKVEALIDEYRSLAHAMQSGVAMMMNYGDSHSPKHLRVGVNSALVECSAMTKLLFAKGIITELEYYTSLRDMMKMEVETYEKRIESQLGAKPGTIKLS